LLGVPAIAGAVVFETNTIQSAMDGGSAAYVWGTTAAFTSALIAMAIVFRVIQGGRFDRFGIYCWTVAVAFAWSPFVRIALVEDVGQGDVTTAATVPPDVGGEATIVARSPGVIAGLGAVSETYHQVDPEVAVVFKAADGRWVESETVVLAATGSFASLLVAERTALNFLQRLSGIATLTAKFVDAVDGTGAKIVDTRKTTPGWRMLEKAAVTAGGGHNHRMGLYDAYLVKENHLAAAGGITAALGRVAVANTDRQPVELEVASLAEIDDALASVNRPDRIMCDNFAIDDLGVAVERIRAADAEILIEASGNVRLDTVRSIATTGVDWISVGALTHSAPALDLSCLIERR
jgi:nicotinate-nucleotide pyrophosphorylase (carboxylating)